MTHLELLVKKHTHTKTPRDLFIRHELFVPTRGWVIVYDLGAEERVAFVCVGANPAVEWDKSCVD